MIRIWNQLKWKGRGGQSLVEYGLILAIVAIVVVAALTLVGHKVSNAVGNISATLP